MTEYLSSDPNDGRPVTGAGGRKFDEVAFRAWYHQQAKRLGLSANPDHPEHFYDWRGAYIAGAKPDSSGHWPSEFKREGHPNLYVDGEDTRTGEPAGGPEYLSTDPEAGEPVDVGVLGRGKRTVSMLRSGDVGGAARYMAEGAGQSMVGAGKGLMTTAANLGDFADWAGSKLGIGERDAEAFEDARQNLAPTNEAQRTGFSAEQGAEFFALPGPGKVRGVKLAVESGRAGLANAGLAFAHGGSGGEAAATGAIGAVPVVQGVRAVAGWVGRQAEPLVRAAIKPTLASMQRIAGASRDGLNAKAQDLVRFIIENRVTSAEKARKIFQGAEHELMVLLHGKKGATVDAPQRAVRYLQALERSAAKQALPKADVATIRDAMREVFDSELGKTVRQVVGPAPAKVPKGEVAARVRSIGEDLRDVVEAPGSFYDEFGRMRDDLSLEETDELWKIASDYTGLDQKGIGVPEWIANRQAASVGSLEGLVYKGRIPSAREVRTAVQKGTGRLYERIVDTVRTNVAREADEAAAAGIEGAKPKTKKVRVLREDVTAAEALERARANAQWSTRKSWGEQKGASKEASKAVERAERDSVKQAVPESRPLLQRQSRALEAERALDRAEFRQSNRDRVGLPATVVAAAEVARGKAPIIGFAVNLLRNNQLRLGIYADKLAKAVERGHAPEIAFYLQKAGVSVPKELMRPAPARP